MQRRGDDPPLAQQSLTKGYTSSECGGNFIAAQGADLAGDGPRPEVTVRLKLCRGHAGDGGVPRKINGIGDERGGAIGHGGALRQHGDCVRDAQ